MMWPNLMFCFVIVCMQFMWYYFIWKKCFKLLGRIVSPDSDTKKKMD